MKNPLLYILIFAAAFILSCEDPIDVDLIDDKEYKLVVNGSINNLDKTHKVFLSWSQGYYKTEEYSSINNATLYISSEKNTHYLTNIGEGCYITDSTTFKTKAGQGYTLHIELGNGDKYEAYDSIRNFMPIDSVFYRYEPYLAFIETKFYRIFFQGEDPKGIGDCYLFNLYLDNERYTDTLDEIGYTDDLFFDGQKIGYDGDVDIFIINENKIEEETTQATFEMEVVNQNYYTYINEILQQASYNGGMFSLPPANVRKTNIRPIGHNKEPLGYWYASAKDTFNFTIMKKQNINPPANNLSKNK